MDTQTLLDNFAIIADAPGGIQRIRETVLDSAIQGRLVRQDPRDEPAATSIERTRTQMRDLVHAGHARANREYSPRPVGERELPRGWAWTYMPELGFINPRNQVAGDVPAGFVPMPLIPTDTRQHAMFEERQWSTISKGYTHIADGDVAVAKITPCFQNGKSTVFNGLPSGVGAATTELYVIRPVADAADPRYLHLFLRSPRFLRAGVAEMTGTAGQQRLPRQYFTDTPIPLPPRAEQQRIVAKVDELMALCDELEEAQHQREHTTTLARTSALHALTTAETDTDRSNAWARIAGNWDSITNPPFSVADLRSLVMDLAARGQLVAQASNDGSASDLVQQIAEHELVSPSDLVKEISAEDEPWDLPASWKWVRLKSIADFKAGKTPATKNPGYWSSDGGIRWATIADMVAGGSVLTTERAVTDRAAAEVFRHDPAPAGTILMSFKLTIGKVARLGAPSYFNEAIVSIKSPFEISDEFLFRFLPLLAPHGGSKAAIKGKTLNKSSISNVLIPLPPLAEQQRIVAKVDELMELCDKLEAVHSDAQSSAAHLAESLSSGQLVG